MKDDKPAGDKPAASTTDTAFAPSRPRSDAPVITPLRGDGASELPPRLEPPHWQVWRHMPEVALWQAVCLSLNIEPAAHLEREASRQRDAYSILPAEYWDRLMLCQANTGSDRAIKVPPYERVHLRCSVAPGDVAAFLAGAGFSVPDEMRACRVTAPAEAAPVVPLGAAEPAPAAVIGPPAAPTTQAEPAHAGATGRAGGKWKDLAREEARRFIAQQRERNLYPNQVIVAETVAKLFTKHKTTGPAGLPLTAAYIKRHALKGICSGAGKLRDIAGHRSK